MSEKYKNFNESVYDEQKGFTVAFIPFESLKGKLHVIDRCKTFEELDCILDEFYGNPGILQEETSTLVIYNDYNYSID